MKKLSILPAALVLIFMLSITVAAEGREEKPPSSDDGFASVSLEIDNSHVYEDMDKAYKDGYIPAIKNGKAIIILPLIARGEIKDNVITARPNLGDSSSSPFVYSNYEKTVELKNNTVVGGTVPSYLVRFDIPLVSYRINGVYPVTVDVKAWTVDGSPIQQSFTCYVTISDGEDLKASEPIQEPEKPTSKPRIIVSGYDINPSPATAGEEFTATVTLKNTSKAESVQNMVVTVSCDSPHLALQNKTNTIYIDKLDKESETDIELVYKSDLEIPEQRYNIMLSIEYDNSDALPLSSSGTIPVTVSQPLQVELEIPRIPEEVNAGDILPLSLQVINMGRSKVYNVRCVLSAPGLIPSGTAFIGNMEAGSAMQTEMEIFVGSMDMTEGYEGEDKFGVTKGVISLIYEDAAGWQYNREIEFSTTINRPVIPSTVQQDEEPKKTGQWWVSIVVGLIVVGGLTAYLVIHGKGRGQNVNEGI